jgi:hypothetical protein
MTTFFNNRTTKRFFFGAVASPTSFIMPIKSCGDEASFGFGIGFFNVSDATATSFTTGVTAGTDASIVGDSDTVDETILGTLDSCGAVPNADVESTIFPHDSRICSELSALFHFNAATKPMKTALPAKKFCAVDDPAVPVVDVTTAAADEPVAAPAAAAFAAEIAILDEVKASIKVGSISNGAPSDLEVAIGAFNGSGANAIVDGHSNSIGNNAIVLSRETSESVILNVIITS